MSGTPRDQSAWVLEEFPDRPTAVRWTYQITDKDYKEAVRQTLERWADRDPVTRENRFGGLDLLRLCIARRVYTNNHMDVIAAALKNVYDRRDEIKRGVKIVWETELMRHFTVKLERL